MRTTILVAAALIVSAASQAGAQTTDSSPDVALSMSLAESVRNIHANIRRNLEEAAVAMPAAEYGFKPTPEVRSFGQILAHVANANAAFCAQAAGERPPQGVSRDAADKDTLVRAVAESLALCDRVYGATDDANFGGAVTVAAGRASTRTTRGALLTFNTAHNTEHYGNLVVYLRLKGIVPPSTARANQRPAR